MKDLSLYMKRMVRSRDETDQRFIKLYRVRKAHRQRIRLGFAGETANPPGHLFDESSNVPIDQSRVDIEHNLDPERDYMTSKPLLAQGD